MRRRKHIRMILFTLALMLALPGMMAEAKTKPGLVAKKKTVTAGKTYRLKLKGVFRRAKVKWKTSRKTVVLRKKEIPLPSKQGKREPHWLPPLIRKRSISAGLRSGKRKRNRRQQTDRH